MPRSRELFYIEDHLIQDSKLHNAILAGGNDSTARKISDKVARRLGLTDTEIAALHRPRHARLDETKDFDPSQPRDEDGKWTDTGGGDDAAPVAPGKRMRVTERPTKEEIDKWKQQITAKQAELEKQDKQGSAEDDELEKMRGALDNYTTALAVSLGDVVSGRLGLNTVYDSKKQLLAASWNEFIADRKAAVVHSAGAIDKGARTKLIESIIKRYTSSSSTTKAQRIETTIWSDEPEVIAQWQEAGFKSVDASGGGTKLVYSKIGAAKPSSSKPSSSKPDLSAPQPIPMSVAKGTSANLKSEVEAAITALPTAVKTKLAEYGTVIKCGPFVTDIYPHLKGKTPRGWSLGSTWDQTEGLYNQRDKAVVVSEFRRSSSGLSQPSRNPAAVVLHEAGHAFDDALGKASINDASLVAAYRDDVSALTVPQKVGQGLSYYLQEGAAGQQEAFAEIFASESGETLQDIRKFFPRVTQWMKQALRTGARPASVTA